MEVQQPTQKMLSCPKAEREGELPLLLLSLTFFSNLLPKPDRKWWAASWSKVAGDLKTGMVGKLATSGHLDARRSHAFSVLLGMLELLLVLLPSHWSSRLKGLSPQERLLCPSRGLNFSIVQVLIVHQNRCQALC